MSSSSVGEPPSAPPSSTGLFARQSTGLVRGVNGRQAIVLNYLVGPAPYGVAVGIFFALAGFPGGNIFLGILLTLPIAFFFVYSFGMMTAAMPRAGGDYLIVGRVLSPVLGLISTCCMMLAVLLSLAFLADFWPSLALAPAFAVIGGVAKSHTLLNWSNTLSTSQGWQYATAVFSLLITGAIMSLGWERAKRFIMWGTGISLVGLLFSALVALFTSQHSFISHFNSTAARLTGKPDTYHDVIHTAQKAGVTLHAGFSFGQSIPIVGVMAGFAIFAFSTSYIGGEIRQGSTMKTAHRMAIASVLILASLAISAAIFFHGWGREFLTAAYGGGFPAALGPSPSYFVLTGLQLNSTIIAVLLSISFILVFPLINGMIIFCWGRILFAWAFDGILPRRVTYVTPYGSPIVAVWILVVAACGALVWAVFGASSFVQIVVYTTLIELIAMTLVGVAAMVFPWRRPELYRASVSNAKLLGVPVVSIVGTGAVLSGAFIWYLYLHYAYFGLTDKGKFFIWVGATILVGIFYYFVARAVRARQGIDLRLVYSEIPPE